MRLVVQRVLESSVKVDGREVGRIGKGFMVLCGVEDGDTAEDVRYCVDKTVNLRIFEDENDKMNRSILDAGGEILAISQFTLHGDVRHGRRPSFIRAALSGTARGGDSCGNRHFPDRYEGFARQRRPGDAAD